MTLAIRTKGALKEEEISEEWIASGFLIEGFLVMRRECAFTGEKQRAIFAGEKIVKFRAKAEVDG